MPPTPDILIVESTYGIQVHEPRMEVVVVMMTVVMIYREKTGSRTPFITWLSVVVDV